MRSEGMEERSNAKHFLIDLIADVYNNKPNKNL